MFIINLDQISENLVEIQSEFRAKKGPQLYTTNFYDYKIWKEIVC